MFARNEARKAAMTPNEELALRAFVEAQEPS
jgi:hypothetical protein